MINEVFNMDCLEGMQMIPDKSIDMIVTDPPYRTISGGTKSKWKSGYPKSVLKNNDGKIFEFNNISIMEYLPHLFRVLKDNSHCYIMTNNLNLKDLLNEASSCGFKFHNMLVWKKNNKNANRWYMKDLEYILFFYKGMAKTINNPNTSQTIEIKNIIGNKLHPTEKPCSLIEVLINNSSKENDTVFDPFMGSGTTAIACINTGRNYIGFEKEEKYYNIIQERIKKHVRQSEMFAA